MFLTKNYVLQNIPKMKARAENDGAAIEADDIKQMYKYEEVPEILELEDEEKFKDIAGNILEIEVRGERNSKNCYFRVKDVSRTFDMPRLQTVLTNKEGEYEREEHYKCFIKNNRKTLYLTYEGMMKVIYCSRPNHKKKERNVINNIKNAFPTFDWICDKCIIGGCSNRRPDLLLDLRSHIIIVEVDENKHSSYGCQKIRNEELSKDLQNRPIVFIRFNPDEYTNKDGILISSCWKKGVLQKEEEWEERINILKQHIQYWIENTAEQNVEIKLFY
jgi:hypothetical protein